MSAGNDRAALLEYLLRWHRDLLPTGAQWLLRAAEGGTLPSARSLEVWLRYVDPPSRREALTAAATRRDTGALQEILHELLLERCSGLVLNRCGQCGGIARTPNAMQCRWCGADWHDSNS